MSIAVSAVIEPSRLLRVALAAYAVLGIGAAIVLFSGHGDRFHHARALGCACLVGAAGAWRARGAATARHIDISGLGEIGLTVQHGIGSGSGNRVSAPRLVRLMPGSTVWPQLLLLGLRDADSAATTVLIILPDCVPPGQFRKLAVAINTIARRDNKFFNKNKIL